MTKIISLQKSVAYQETIEETQEYIQQFEDTLFAQAVNLCCCTCWSGWHESKDAGDEVEFDVEMLKDAGDENVIMLVEMMERMNNLRRFLQ